MELAFSVSVCGSPHRAFRRGGGCSQLLLDEDEEQPLAADAILGRRSVDVVVDTLLDHGVGRCSARLQLGVLAAATSLALEEVEQKGRKDVSVVIGCGG